MSMNLLDNISLNTQIYYANMTARRLASIVDVYLSSSAKLRHQGSRL